MSIRTTTAQELLENQDPDVLYTTDEVTKVVTPIGERPKKRAAAKKAEEPKAPKEEAKDEPAEGDRKPSESRD